MNNLISQEEINRINKICRQYYINGYTINYDGSIDVNGCVSLSNNHLTTLPLKFNKVSSYFDCSHNKLTSLEGVPTEIGSTFWYEDNNLPDIFDKAFNVLTGKDKQIFLKYQSYYDVWLPEFNEENMQLLIDDIKDGLE